MQRVSEAVLAVVLILALGVGFWLFADRALGGSENSGDAIVIDSEAAARGETLAVDTGCAACHTVDGTPGSGPTWKGLYGSSRPLASGEAVTADDAYLRNSMLDPLSQLVAGFEAVMPTTYSEQLTETEINDLVEYIKSLG